MVSKVILSVLLAAALSSAQQAATTPVPQSPTAQPPASSGSDFFNATPPGVEEGLRARLKLFYDCYLTGKFRQAFELVAEENKDDYFNRAKTPYHSYKIGTIQFSDNFTKAKVLVVVNRDFHFQGRTMAVDVPLAETWKIENGQWVWYLLNKDIRQTPFGIDAPTPSNSEANGNKRSIPRDPASLMAAYNRLAWPDKPVLTLGAANEFQDRATLTNNSNQLLVFHLEFEPLAGLKVEPATGQIEPGHSLALQAKYESSNHTLPPDLKPRQIKIHYDGGGMVQVEIVWDKGAPAKTATAQMHP